MKKTRINQRRFFLNIILPSILTFGLFIILIFSFIIPYFEQNMLQAKKEMTRELVNACIGIADRYHQEELSGKISPEQARENAMSGIGNMRYGINNKDYFWITDMKPVMVMHPYRPDLNGEDLTEFRDPDGKALFVEMVEAVKENGSGYVDYRWQWMDDSSRIVPKISYVSEYKPWGWVIGTGVYIGDIRTEISSIIRRLLFISLGISLIMAVLLFIIVRNNLRAERRRSTAEEELQLSRERYKALVEASAEGTLMILNGRCVYANQQALEIFGAEDLSGHRGTPEGFIHPSCAADVVRINRAAESSESGLRIETLLSGYGGTSIPALLMISPIQINNEKGLIIIIRDLRSKEEDEIAGSIRSSALWLLAGNLGLGAFRAQPGRKGRFIKANQQAAKILGFSSIEEMLRFNILDMVEDDVEKMKFLRALAKQGSVKSYTLQVRKQDGTYADIEVTATLINNEEHGLPFTEGFFEDISGKSARENLKNQIAADAIAHSQYHAATAGTLAKPAVSCPPETKITDAILLMMQHKTSCVLVKNQELPLGIVSHKNLIANFDSILRREKTMLAEIMTSPLPRCNEENTLAEVFHTISSFDAVAVFTKTRIIGIITADDLTSVGLNPDPLIHAAIEEAVSIGELKAAYNKLPFYVSLLVNSGAKNQVITRLVGNVADSITGKICRMILREMGQPPAPFSIICMGSQGRGEQTLVTDQDNAIIFDTNEENTEAARKYFLEFGDRMNRMLAETGYELCRGGFMAGNPRWCRSLPEWTIYFRDLIENPEPQNLLDTSIFFDFRAVFGESDLAFKLRDNIGMILEKNPGFFGQMARVCISYKIPLGMFGKLQTESRDDQENSINIKNAIRLIVNIVRLYATKHGLRETSTPERLMSLFSGNVISSALHADLLFAFAQLSQMQFANQVRQYSEMKPMDHFIDLANLPGIETDILKAVFSRLSTLQNRIRYDFGLSAS